MDGSVLVERDAEARVAGERVAIVCMPFASSDRPSIQLGLVGAITRRAGYETDLLHFNLNLASRLGAPLYERLCQSRQHMTGEWLFSIAAFGADAPSTPENYFAAFPGEADWAAEIGSSTAGLAELRETVLPQFVDDCAAAVDWTRYRVVGFSSARCAAAATPDRSPTSMRCPPPTTGRTSPRPRNWAWSTISGAPGRCP